MSDRPWGILAVVAVAAPVCTLCIAGPVVLGSLLGSLAAWLSGSAGIVAIFAGLFLGAVILLTMRNRQRRRATPTPRADGSPLLK